jgi:hypothetical protein
MINALTFAVLVMAAEAWLVWLAYCMGFQNGWLNGWDQRRVSGD